MEEQVEILKRHFGNYSRVAKELGITPRQFRRIRNGQSGCSRMVQLLIDKLIQELVSGQDQAA